MSAAEERGSVPDLGILLVNLGSPSEPTPRAVRRFLDEFLGDPMVIDANPLIWWLVRKLVVLPRRGRSSAELYAKVWGPGGSPLLAISRLQRAALAEALEGKCPVELGMRYGEPSIEDGLRRLAAAGARRVRLLSMFPQASKTTTGTVEQETRRALARLEAPLEVSVVPPYFDHPAYVEALRATIAPVVERQEVEHVVFSLHGLPKRYVNEGDPYQAHCIATARTLADVLGLAEGEWTLAYQSRFGREPWLEPSTVDVVRDLARRRVRTAVACPGFPADCLETLEEIGIQLAATFREHGGGELVVVPCLNDDEVFVGALRTLALEDSGATLASP